MIITSQFKHRLFFSSLSIIGLAISIYYSFDSFFTPIFVLLHVGITSLALAEYYYLAQNKGFQPLAIYGIGFSTLYILAVALSLHQRIWVEFPSLVLLGSFLLLFLLFFKQRPSALVNLAITLFGIGYLAIPLSYALRINYFFSNQSLQDGRLWLAYVLLTSKITDIGAYFCGKIFGKIKLAPSISPQKTIEGAVGGTLTALITSFFFTLITSSLTSFKMTLVQSVWIGLITSILAQLGDLTESLLKRDAGVKDSSYLPGLGGILDVVDSLVFTLPLMYIFLEMGIIG